MKTSYVAKIAVLVVYSRFKDTFLHFFHKFSVNTWLVILLLLMSLVFRGVYSDLTRSFGQDAARDAVLIEQYANQKSWFIPYGPKVSVWNFRVPAGYYQIHLWASGMTGFHPLTMKWVVTGVEALTPVLVYLLLNMFIRKKYAFVGAVLYLISPVAILYATRAWNPSMVPFFSTLGLYGVLQSLLYQKKWGIYASILSAMFLVHLHFQALFLFPFYAIAFVYLAWKYQILLPHILIAVALALTTLLPYFAGELASGWQNTRAIQSFFTDEHSRYYDSVSKPSYLISFIPSFFEKNLIGVPKNEWLGRIIFFGGMFILAWKAIHTEKYRWILLYIFTILVMLRVYKGIKLDYYMSILFIFPAVFAAMLLQQSKTLGAIILVVISTFYVKHFNLPQPSDDLASLKNDVVVLDSVLHGSSFRLLAHNNESVNTLGYGISRWMEADPSATAPELIEVCEQGAPCAWSGYIGCMHSRPYTYAALLKTDNPHEQRVVTGQLYNYLHITFLAHPVLPDYDLYTDDVS